MRRLDRLVCLAGLALLALLASGCAHAQADPPATATAAVRLLALGDSFTIGTGTSPDRSLPARLAGRWACPVALRNLAVNGYTTQDVIDRELPDIAAFEPALVTLAVGANDIVQGSTPDGYRAQVRRILGGIAAGASHARIVVIPQPDWALSPAAAAFGEPSQIEARIVEYNAILQEETSAAGGLYVDLFGLMQTQARAGMLAGDGLHPSAAAYDAWAGELARDLPSPCASPRPAFSALRASK